jgi:indole-3-glycerol phosphate synthase
VNRSARVDSGILDRIVATKREEVERLAEKRVGLRRAAEQAEAARPFGAALSRRGEVSVIAEFKRKSPSAGALERTGAGAGAVAGAYAAGGAAALSVLTDGEYFGGSLEDLRSARAAVEIPVLRKDFVVDETQIWEARAAGADAVLLIVRLLDDVRLAGFLDLCRELRFSSLVEVHDAAELERAVLSGAPIVGINNRDLKTFRTDLAVSSGLVPGVPADRVVVAESGIRVREDVERLGSVGVDAILVGETLMRAGAGAAAVAGLAGVPKRDRDRDSGHWRASAC